MWDKHAESISRKVFFRFFSIFAKFRMEPEQQLIEKMNELETQLDDSTDSVQRMSWVSNLWRHYREIFCDLCVILDIT